MQLLLRNYFLLFIISLLSLSQAFAQNDTSKPQSITIISSYKPVLRNAAKINFSGSNLSADTAKNIRPYNVPIQNLLYSYQPITLKPLAVENDTLIRLGERYVGKLGFGNYKTPYLNAAASFGDGETSLINVYANYISSKGKIDNQDYSDLTVKGTGSYFLSSNEIYATAGFSRKQYYLYGYDHDRYNYNKNDASQQLNQLDFSVGYSNTTKNNWGVNYNPNIKISFFSLAQKLNENTIQVQLPAEKKLGNLFIAKVEAYLDHTLYETKNLIPYNYQVKNNLIRLSPSLFYKTDLFKLNGGVNIFFNNGKFSLLPNVFGEMAFGHEKFIIQGGWTSKIQKNTYQYLTAINPYLSPVTDQQNTVQSEIYGGIKSSIGKHILFSAKASLIVYKNFQLFINDTSASADGRNFFISNENSMDNFSLHGDISYVIRDVFKLSGGITFNGYTGLDENARAWNTVPVECNAALRWSLYKKFTVKGDLYFFGGGRYLDKGNVSRTFNGAADLSLGVDYKINNHFGAFINLNNIFGKKYERWHNYPVYGLNAIAGVSFKF